MKKTIGKRLLSSVTALLIAASYMLPSSLSVFAADADEENAYNLSSGEHYSKATLLAGSSDLKKDTIAETIKAYQERYLLGVAADFSVFTEGNFDVWDCDAEGRVAVGGNFIIDTSWGSYVVGAGDYGYYSTLDDLLGDRQGAATIILGGELTKRRDDNDEVPRLGDTYYDEPIVGGYKTKYESTDGNDNFGKPTKTPTKKTNKKLVLNSDTDPRGSWTYKDSIQAESGPGNYQKIDQKQTYVGEVFSFAAAFKHMRETAGKQLLDNAAAQKIQGTVTYDAGSKTITFTYPEALKDIPQEYVYFTLPEGMYENFRNAQNIKYENIPKLPVAREVAENVGTDSDVESVLWETAYIVVNVRGTGESGSYNNEVVGNISGNFYHISNANNGTPEKKSTYINGEPISNKGDMGQASGTAAQQTNNDPGVTSLIYHFVDADHVVMGGNFAGTVFAPNSDVTDEQALHGVKKTGTNDDGSTYSYFEGGHGHLSGGLIAKSFVGFTEFGYRPFAGPAMGINFDYEYAVTLSKQDQDKNPLTGAKFDLYKYNDETDEWDKDAERSPITAGTEILIDGLKAGKYKLVETEAPAGCKSVDEMTDAEKTTEFEIKDGKPVSVQDIGTGEFGTITATEYKVNDTLPDGSTLTQDMIDADKNHEKYISVDGTYGASSGYSWSYKMDSPTTIQMIGFNSDGLKFTNLKIVFTYNNGESKTAFESNDFSTSGYDSSNVVVNDNVSKDNVVSVTVTADGLTMTGSDKWGKLLVNWDEVLDNIKASDNVAPPKSYYVVADDEAEDTIPLDSGEIVYATKGEPVTVNFAGYSGIIGNKEVSPLTATKYIIDGKTVKLTKADGKYTASLEGYTVKVVDVEGGHVVIYKGENDATYKVAQPIMILDDIVVTNIKKIESTTSVSITKKWQYGTKDAIPEGVKKVELQVTIKKGDEDVTETIVPGGVITLPIGGKWEWSKDELPDGKYTITIDKETVYDNADKDITAKFSKTESGAKDVIITNYYLEEKGKVEVTKEWKPFERGGYKFDNYPNIKFTLTSDAGYGPITKDLTDLKATFENLPVYKYTVENGVLKKGAAIIYTLTEIDVDGYTSSINTADKKWSFTLEELTDGLKAVTVTNEYNKTDLTIDKEWAGFDGTHPDKITVNVIGKINDTNKTTVYTEEVTITGDASAKKWTQKVVKDLPTDYYDDKGNHYTITYDIEEVTPTDYVAEKGKKTGEDNAFTLKNTYVGGTTIFTVIKTWDDNNDAMGFRPDQVIVHVQITKTDANGTTTDVINEDVTLYEKDSWKKTFGNYPIYADKNDLNSKLTYEIKVTETNPPDAYVLESITTDTNTNIVTVNNKYKNEDAGTKFEINKEWSDTVPEGAEVTVHVVIKNDIDGTTVFDENVTLNAKGNWSWTTVGKDLKFPKYSVNAKGEVVESTYTMTVTEISATINGTTITVGQSDYFRVDYSRTSAENKTAVSSQSVSTKSSAVMTIKNKYAMTDLEIEKNWDANGWTDEEAAFRPKDKITVHVVGRVAGKTEPVFDEDVTLTNNNTNKWTTTKSLPKYYIDGSVIEYEITESLPGYTATGTGKVTGNKVSITNKYNQETTDVSVTKVWDDDDASLRPKSITLTVTIMQGDKQYGEPITVTLPDDGKIVDGKWVWTKTGLPKYSDVANKTPYEYKVTAIEADVPAYELTGQVGNGTSANVTLTNTCINKETGAQFEINKVWTDGGLDHTKDAVKVYLNISNGVNAKPITEAMITLNKDNGWKWSSTSLSLLKFPAYAIADDGKTVKACTYTMTVTEVELIIDGETVEIEDSDYTVTYSKPSVTFKGTKASITITNKLKTIKTVEATATKIWDDHNDVKGLRPTTDGFKDWIVVKDKDGKTVAVDESQIEILQSVSDPNSWSIKVTDLADDGEEGATYTITEDATKLGDYKSSTSNDGKTITNTLADRKQYSVSVNKTWEYGADDENENKPTEAEFEITIWGVYGANNTKVDVTSKYIEAAADGKYYITTKNGEWKLENLPEYGYDGETEVLFTGYVIKVTEQEIEGYTPDDIEDNGTAADLVVNNRFNGLEGTASVSINKVWNDNSGKWGTRPATDAEFLSWFVVKQDGKPYTLPEGITPVLTKTDDNHWKIKVSGLPKYKDAFEGTEYKYTIEEIIPDKYKDLYTSTLSTDGKTVTNKLDASGDFTVSVEKKWDHKTNAKKPEEIAKIKVEIFGTTGGKDIDVTKVYADKLSYDAEGKYYYVTIKGNNTAAITGLLKYGYDADGVARVFTGYKVKATEMNTPADYKATYSSAEAAEKITVYNTFNLNQGSVTVSGKKTWIDNNNALGVRPAADKFTVVLYADGIAQSDKPTWTYDGNVWTYTFADLPEKNANNEPISYTVKEVYDSPYYTADEAAANGTNGYDFTNRIKDVKAVFAKVNEKGDYLKGAVLAVYAVEGTERTLVERWTTDVEPHEIVNKLIPGKTYVLVEEEAPNGYAYAEDKEFTMSSDGTITSVTMEDLETEVRISKIDGESADKQHLKGAVLAIYTLDGELIDQWSTTDGSYILKGMLKAGETYILRELSAPDGYYVGKEQKFTVSMDGTPTTVEFVNYKTTVQVSKFDEDNKLLSGAVLQILDKDNNVVEQWTSGDTAYTIKGLIAGETYTLHELTAPEGYQLAADVKFTVNGDGTVTVVSMVDKLIVDNKVEGEEDGNKTDTDGDDDDGKRPTGSEEDAPQTGDPINGVLPIAIIALAMASLMMRKKEEK